MSNSLKEYWLKELTKRMNSPEIHGQNVSSFCRGFYDHLSLRDPRSTGDRKFLSTPFEAALIEQITKLGCKPFGDGSKICGHTVLHNGIKKTVDIACMKDGSPVFIEIKTQLDANSLGAAFFQGAILKQEFPQALYFVVGITAQKIKFDPMGYFVHLGIVDGVFMLEHGEYSDIQCSSILDGLFKRLS